MVFRRAAQVLMLGALFFSSASQSGQGKLLATPGVSQLEGSGGGGIVPWATLAGYASRDEIAASVFATRVSVDEFRLDAWGAAVNFYDRLELSAAHHDFWVKPLGVQLGQDIVAAKLRLVGDLVYSTAPQVSVGIQHKRLDDGLIASAVGAKNSTDGTDYYIAAAKLHLGAIAGYNALWNITARATKANQLGLLGFGGDINNSYDWQLEASAALLLSRSLAVGIEYRQKPNNLGFAEEQDWHDVFIAWIPNKSMNITAAWADLGSIAGEQNQTGVYVSLTGYVW